MVVSEDFANLAVLSPGVKSSFSQKVRFVPQKRRNNTSNRSEVSANATFLAKLSNKEIYFKNGS
jgi:hypothetical protein